MHSQLSPSEREHRRSDQPQPPGSGRTRRSAVARAGCRTVSSGGAERDREGPLAYVPAWALLLSVVIACRDAAVGRKQRSHLVPAKPSGWCAFRLPVRHGEAGDEGGEVTRLPRDQDAAVEGRAGGTRHALQRLRGPAQASRGAVGDCRELRGPRRATVSDQPPPRESRPDSPIWDSPERVTPPPSTTTDFSPPESPASVSSPPVSPIWEGPLLDGFQLAWRKRKSPPPTSPPTMMVAEPPTVEAASPPTMDAAPAPVLDQRRKKNKPVKRCDHCGSSATPKWREGPKGPLTLCNACGVRYKEGRLLPEYRPQASPSFDKTMHATKHIEVLELRRQEKNKQQQQQLPPPPSPPAQRQPADDSQDVDLMMGMLRHLPLPRNADYIASAVEVGDDAGASGTADDPMDVALDPFLLEGPAAPMIIEPEAPCWILID